MITTYLLVWFSLTGGFFKMYTADNIAEICYQKQLHPKSFLAKIELVKVKHKDKDLGSFISVVPAECSKVWGIK